MIREALEFLSEQFIDAADDAIVTDADGNEYRTRHLTRLDEEPPPEPRVLSGLGTLSSVAAYVALGEVAEPIVIVGHDKARVLGRLGRAASRAYFLGVEVAKPSHRFGSWLTLEDFNVWLMTSFVATDERSALLQVTGNVTSKVSRSEGDDGMATSLEVRKGIASATRETVGPVVTLQPYCTWPEIDQPERPFVIRFRRGATEDDPLAVALFEGQDAWWADAAQRAAAWLRENIAESAKATVLA